MFLGSGEGVVFKGAVGPWYSETDKSFHLSKEKAAELMALVVDAYANTGSPQMSSSYTARYDSIERNGLASLALFLLQPSSSVSRSVGRTRSSSSGMGRTSSCVGRRS